MKGHMIKLSLFGCFWFSEVYILMICAVNLDIHISESIKKLLFKYLI